MLKLIKCSRNNPYYQEIRERHYVPNKGCIGRQIHYLIYDGDDILNKPIGIISGASAVWSCEARDDFFWITKENRTQKINQIINNVVFRLEKNDKNLASRVLAMWRKQIVKDWKEKYGMDIIGFETFVNGGKKGTVYRADNWTCVGETKGFAKNRPHGIQNPFIRRKTEPKYVYCKKC